MNVTEMKGSFAQNRRVFKECHLCGKRTLLSLEDPSKDEGWLPNNAAPVHCFDCVSLIRRERALSRQRSAARRGPQ